MLLALSCSAEEWPPFCADLVFELYSRRKSSDPAVATSHSKEASVSSPLTEDLWLRVAYLGSMLPLARNWGLQVSNGQAKSGNTVYTDLSDDDCLVPLTELLRRWKDKAISPERYTKLCRSYAHGNPTSTGLGPKTI
ncbi:unnamed protein product [Protopolystoma xenopodis]|uniref:Uncharacterized protein n=1 Tax=Protopolystoma xenopodis TaxID=117903 RepID=A0A448XR82_9PLAT|nr:unnamed protein product [Protopolystoma xenopodis]